MNGTEDEITSIGVKLVNTSLCAFQSDLNGLNRFSDLQNGIRGEGNSSLLGTYIFMDRIRGTSIHIQNGSIRLSRSSFDDIGRYGIIIRTARIVSVWNSQFRISNVPDPTTRLGIYVESLGLNSDIQINGIDFGTDINVPDSPVRGVFIRGGNTGAGTTIKITGSTFDFRAPGSQGILLLGSFPETTTSQIWNNFFRISSFFGSGALNQRTHGVLVDANVMNNLSIKWNSFTSYAVRTFPPGTIGIPQANYGVELKKNTTGVNNEVSVNGFHDGVQSLTTDLRASGFQNVRYCSNTFRGGGFSNGVVLTGNCAGTDFDANEFDYASQDVLLLDFNPIIGPQVHKGNKWFNLGGIESTNHVTCEGNPALNRFVVHTPQSTAVNEGDSGFSPYYPRNIQWDMTSDLFDIDPFGLPSTGCNYESPLPEVKPLDVIIADGNYSLAADDFTTEWELNRHLYQKLSETPEIIAQHPAFSGFMAFHASNSIGGFYEVYAAVKEAQLAESEIDEQSKQALERISVLIDSLEAIDLLIEENGLDESLTQLRETILEELNLLDRLYDGLKLSYDAQVISNLQYAYELNETLEVTSSYEVNEKMVNRIYLSSLMQQNGELTEEQIAVLETIALQDRNTGGAAVEQALSLLPDCNDVKESIENLGLESVIESVEHLNSPGFEEVDKASFRETIVYPNPADSQVTVGFSQERTGLLTLRDMTGKICLQSSIRSTNEAIMDLVGLSPGVYLLQLVTDSGVISLEKIIVQ